jgi:hypothetical protein
MKQILQQEEMTMPMIDGRKYDVADDGRIVFETDDSRDSREWVDWVSRIENLARIPRRGLQALVCDLPSWYCPAEEFLADVKAARANIDQLIAILEEVKAASDLKQEEPKMTAQRKRVESNHASDIQDAIHAIADEWEHKGFCVDCVVRQIIAGASAVAQGAAEWDRSGHGDCF